MARRHNAFGHIALGVALLAMATSTARANLIITPIFDSSITSQSNAAAIEVAIDSAIGMFESSYGNSINVKIDFEAVTSGLGQSEYFDVSQTYSQFYSALVSKDANPSAIAGLNANGGNSTLNPVTQTSSIQMTTANARALGLSGAALCNVTGSAGNLGCSTTNFGGANAVDGIVGINTSITDPPQANNGSNYGLVAVVEHEVDEVLGLGSSLPDYSASSGTLSETTPKPEDLFRYNANGTRASLSVNCASPGTAFFSYSGVTDLAQFNNACNGADFGDWQSDPLPNNTVAEVQDAYSTPGSNPAYGINEIDALTSIGYTYAAPEPSSGALLALALGGLIVARRRRFIGSE